MANVITKAPLYMRGNSGNCFDTMDKRLQAVAKKTFDIGMPFTIIVSYRDEKAQLAAYKAGRSKLKRGAHNYRPSRAFDFLPYPFVGTPADLDPWNNILPFRALGHAFNASGFMVGVDVVWGADWNDDGSEADEHGLRDFDHIELKDWRTAK